MSSLLETSQPIIEPQASSGRLQKQWLLRFTIAIIFVATLVWARTLWWSPSFQALARRSLDHRDSMAALRWLDLVTAFAPEDAETAFLRARAHRKRGDMVQAAAALERAHSLGITLARLVREQWLAQAQSGQMHEAEPHLTKMLMDPGGDGQDICEAFTLGYLRTQRHGQALQLLQAWMADWPHSAIPYLMRGRLRTLQSDLQQAEADFRRAIELAPENREVRLELALVLERSNRLREAVPLFEGCLDDLLLATRAQLGLAACLKALGDNARAKSYLQQAAKVSPGNPEVLRELGRTALESGDYVAASRFLEEALRIIPYDDETHYLLAQTMQAAGKSEAAQTHFEFVRRARTAFQELNLLEDDLRKHPGQTSSLVRAGEILLEFSDPDEGVVRLLTALDRDPKHQQARRLLVEYYERRTAQRPEFRRLAEFHRAWLANEEPPVTRPSRKPID